MSKNTTTRFSSTPHRPKAMSWIVEDDSEVASTLQEMFKISGSETSIFDNGKDLLAAFEAGAALPDIICLDLTLPDLTGLDLIPSIRKANPLVPVLAITANRSPEIIERAVELGVYDYVPKNAERAEFERTVQRALEYHNLHKELNAVRNQSTPDQKKPTEAPFFVWLGDYEEMQRIALTDVPVLLSGESGTGKQALSCMIHMMSGRNKEPFVTVQCAGLGLEDLERELFGHEPNAFTLPDGYEGALQRADGGTLLIEEIEELDLATQARLVRFLTRKRFSRIGSIKELDSDCRIIVTTGCDLRQKVNEQKFRKNLFYQLTVAEIDLLPLRHRKSDITTLAEHFVRHFGHQFNKRISLTPEAKDLLMNYSWPGNIRELKNVIQSAMIQCGEQFLHTCHLPNRIRTSCDPSTAPVSTTTPEAHSPDLEPRSTPTSIEEQEKRLILDCLQSTGGNISQAAGILGISRATFYRKMKKYNSN